MSDTYPCAVAGCDAIFTKAWELKKHKVLHERPERVHRCPECAFYTLYEKNLAIHIRKHTDERLQCPDMVTSNGISTRCEYRTKDPTPLLKHRKKVHGYVPNANRGPKTAGAPARTTDGNAPMRYAPYTRPAFIPNHKPPQASTSASARGSADNRLAPPPPAPPVSAHWSPPSWQSTVGAQRQPNPVSASPDAGDATDSLFSPSLSRSPSPSLSLSLSRSPSPPPAQRLHLTVWAPLFLQSNVGAQGPPDPAEVAGSAPTIPTSEPVTSYREPAMDLNVLEDPSLDPNWMARYAQTYSAFE